MLASSETCNLHVAVLCSSAKAPASLLALRSKGLQRLAGSARLARWITIRKTCFAIVEGFLAQESKKVVEKIAQHGK